MTEDQIAESLASMLTRYAALKGYDEETLLKDIEGILEDAGFRCVEGVWQKTF